MAEKGIPTQIEIIHGDTVQNGIPTPENPIVPVSLTGFERKMTNGDLIRKMSDEELVEKIGCACRRCVYYKSKKCVGADKTCAEGNLEWLKREVHE